MTSTAVTEDRDQDLQDNITRQSEELEILRSIYASDFQIEDDFTSTFSIVVHVGEVEGEEATLVVSYNLNYPSKGPPIYHLSVPWLDADAKGIICNALDDYYISHLDEPVVYSWVELLREMLLNMKPESLTPVTNRLINQPSPSSISETSHTDNDNNEDLTDSFHEISLSQKRDFTKQGKNVQTERGQGAITTIFTGEPLTDRKSTFQAHVASVYSADDVKLVLEELYKNKKVAAATHNMYAYRMTKEGEKNSNISTQVQDCEDDGETHAGSRLLHLLQILDCRNVIVIVSRWYGGIMLHGDRFKHINNVTRILLEKHGFINKTSSK